MKKSFDNAADLNTESMGFRWQNFIYVFLVVLFGLGISEGLLRLLGKQPYQANATHIDSYPTWSLCPHSTLGIALNPGVFSVTINEGLTYSCTHLKDSSRLTQADRKNQEQALKKVFLYGCSFTYGMGVDDSTTFVYQLQTALPDWQVFNYGVPAYGTIQSLLQLQKHLDAGRVPDLVFLNYSSLHDARNKLSPAQQKYWQEALGNVDGNGQEVFATANFPYVDRIDQEPLEIKHLHIDQMKKRWSLSYVSAFCYLLEVVIDHILDGFQDKQIISQKIILAFAELCKTRQIPLVVVGMTQDEATLQMLDFCRSKNMATLDCGIDIRQTDYNLLPYDNHPNGRAHLEYARRFIDRMKQINQ